MLERSKRDTRMFMLTKWYLDCVDDAGRAVILYWASLQWGLLRLQYGGVLAPNLPGAGGTRYTMRPGGGPVPGADRLAWRCDRLDVTGTWTRREPPVVRTLLERPDGSIRWRCFSPRADADVRVGDVSVHGCGYAEWLTMTLPPWRIPFRRLRWGRFHGAGHSLVWIDLQGGCSRTEVFADAIEQPGAEVRADAVTLATERTTLVLDRDVTLRSGRLLETGLRPLRLLVSLMPRWRNAHESKWLTRAALTGPRGRTEGWAVHEEVTWR